MFGSAAAKSSPLPFFLTQFLAEKDPYLTEKWSKIAFFAIFGLILAVPGPVFSIFSPDMTKKKKVVWLCSCKELTVAVLLTQFLAEKTHI